MTNAEKLALQKHACRIRMGVIESTHSAKSGHPGGSLSIAEVLSFLYFREMRVDPANPAWPERDRLVLSKGHAAPALYAALAERGFFPAEELLTLRKIGSRLQGHPNMNTVPGVDMSTGSLGQGISSACGMALGAKVKGLDQVRVYAIMGDGEIEEGECWEAFMFASHYKLDNLCVFLDLNHLQIDGPIEKVMIHAEKGRPTFIILNTTKGKGVSYMENNANWHGKGPGDDDYRTAMDELNAAMARLEKEEC